MKLDVKYFGMLAESTGLNSETFDVPEKIAVRELKALVLEKYASLEKFSFRIAYRLELVQDEDVITESGEIAFLPPFAGG